jgi:Icc protein
MSEQHSHGGDTLARRPFSSEELLARLVKSEDKTLRFIHISDTHINPDPNYQLPEADHTTIQGAKALIHEINSLPFEPDFVLHTGDVVYDPDVKAYEAAGELLTQLKYPIYYLAGNHDDPHMLQHIMLRHGVDDVLSPFDYQFELKGIQIVAVDSNGPAQKPAGAVTKDQLARLDGIAKAQDSRPLVVAVHHNVLPNDSPWWDGFMRMTNGEEFHRALLPARERLRGVFHGHVHQCSDVYRDGILYSSVASSWYQLQCYPGQTLTLADRGTPPGYSIAVVTPEQSFVRRHYFRVPSGG